MDALPGNRQVLSLSTVFARGQNLLGDDIGSVELAIVQKSLPPDVSAMMDLSLIFPAARAVRVTVPGQETVKDLRRDKFTTTCVRTWLKSWVSRRNASSSPVCWCCITKCIAEPVPVPDPDHRRGVFWRSC